MKLCKRDRFEDIDEDYVMNDVIRKIRILSIREEQLEKYDPLVGSLKQLAVVSSRKHDLPDMSLNSVKEAKKKHYAISSAKICLPSDNYKRLDILAASSAYQDLAKLHKNRMYFTY